MLSQSSAYADLRARNRFAVGSSALQRNVDIASIASAYASQFRMASTNRYEVDLPEEYLESAWIGDWEASYDIAVRQFASYSQSLRRNSNPAWTAVTGYYSAFFSARTFLYSAGIGYRKMPQAGPMSRGLYRLEVAAQPAMLGMSTLVCIKHPNVGSHVATWKGLKDVLAALVSIGGLDAKSLSTISSAEQLITFPQHVSAFRNWINYSLEIADAPPTAWTSDLKRLEDASELERAIASSVTTRAEVRIELVQLACLSWVQTLYSDYLERARHPDTRRGRIRSEFIKSQEDSVREILERWV